MGWVNISSGTPTDFSYNTNNSGETSTLSISTITGVGTGTFQYKCVGTFTGLGCNASVTSNAGSIVIVSQPVAPTITPNVAPGNVCAGQNISATFGTGSNGTGTVSNVFEFSIDGGSTFNTYSPSQVISTNSLGGQTVIIRSSRTANGSGCNSSGYTTDTWNITAQPVAATITPNVAAGTVCAGQSLSATFSGASGGSGTVTDVYEYSIDGGSTYNTYTAAINTSTLAGQTVIIRSSRTATGSGCNFSGYNTVTWTVVAQPVAATITPDIAAGNVCEGQTLSATFSGASGGSGTIADVYEYSINGGDSYNPYTANTPISTTGLVGQTVIIRSSRTSTGTGCNTSSYNTVTWVVNANPTGVIASNTGPYVITQTISLSASPTNLSSYQWSAPDGYTASGQTVTRGNATTGMTETYTVTVTSSAGCTATASTNVVVTVNATYTWTGVSGTDWTVPGNWIPTAPVGGPNNCAIDVVIPAVNNNNNPVISSLISVGNVQMNANAQLTLNGANMNVCKNWQGSNTSSAAVVGTGVVTLNGSSAQLISGYTKFQELMLDNSNGAQMQTGSAVDIYTALDLKTGTFDATNGTLTFKSTSVTNVGIINNFSTNYGGTITGNIKAERYYDGSTTYNQHYMGSPVNTPALSQFGATGTPGYVIPQPTCT